MCNIHHIEILSKKLKPLMILCSESRVTNDICDEIKIDGYNEIVCASKNRFTGGVVIYIQKQLKFKTVLMSSIDNTLWCLTIELLNCKWNGLYSCFYRANNTPDLIFNESFDEFLSNAVNQNKFCVCTGDLNLNMNENTAKVKRFTNLYNIYGLKYVSDFFTRITNDSQTKIDVVLANMNERVICNAMPNEKISDHETIRIEILSKEKTDFN